jgi:hypothetical protein
VWTNALNVPSSAIATAAAELTTAIPIAAAAAATVAVRDDDTI